MHQIHCQNEEKIAMKAKTITFALATALTLGATGAQADHTETILGAAIGGATGAAVGRSMGGSSGEVIIWSAIGGAAGAAVGHSLGSHHEREVVVHRRIYHEQPYVVVRRPRPVYYVYEEPVRYHKAKHGHGHGHRHHHRDRHDD
jgi:outer membrane lipoprotein SlyB